MSLTGAKIIHVFMFNLKPGVTEELKEQIFAAGRRITEIAGVLGVDIGPNIGDNPAYKYTGIFYHTSAQTREVYRTHPIHREFGDKWLRPNLENMVFINMEVKY
ncbi:MAG: Dabb family protein [Chloroflexi bacterium]|nr:Dabb family protein [Chloroflexota bacterium]